MWRGNSHICRAVYGVRLSTRLVAPSAIRSRPNRAFAATGSSAQATLATAKSPTMAQSAEEHKPQPTESEADVAADRSPIDPIHRSNPTESHEDIEADRSSNVLLPKKTKS